MAEVPGGAFPDGGFADGEVPGGAFQDGGFADGEVPGGAFPDGGLLMAKFQAEHSQMAV